MLKSNPENTRLKHNYMRWLRTAENFTEASIDQHMAALYRYEAFIGYRSFAPIKIADVTAFKTGLTKIGSDEPLSPSSVQTTLKPLLKFHKWLADQKGYRSKVRLSDAAYFKPPSVPASSITVREKIVPTLDQVNVVLNAMPATTDIQKRDRGMIAFLALTGARDGALISFKLRHLDIGNRVLIQDGKTANIKFDKSFNTWFFPVGDDIEQIVVDWARHVTEQLGFDRNDPLFPKTKMGHLNGMFQPMGLSRAHWASAQRVREIVKAAFKANDFPTPTPHTFRDMLALLGQELGLGPKELTAWSQNLGHENLSTTLMSYGKVAPNDQASIIRGLREREQETDKSKSYLSPEDQALLAGLLAWQENKR